MKSKLQTFLNKYPWDKHKLENQKPIEFVWEFDLCVGAKELWPHLIDTSKFNRALGLPQMNFEEIDGRLHGSTVNAGFRQAWIEDSWQWVEHESIIGGRTYSEGFGRYVRVIYDLKELSESKGVRLTVYFGWLPRSVLSRLLLKKSMSWLKGRYSRLLTKIVAEIEQAKPVFEGDKPEPLTDLEEQRIKYYEEKMTQRSLDSDAVRHLFNFIRTSDEIDAYRVRVPELARKTGINEINLLKTCLHATRLGLLHMSWDLICPHCRGVRVEYTSLKNVEAEGFCEACSIEFGSEKENALEITFHIDKKIREVPKVFYCSAEPSTKKHIKFQQVVEAGKEKTISPSVSSGRYRLRVLGKEVYQYLDLYSGSDNESVRWNPAEKKDYEAEENFNITLVNQSQSPETYIMEDVGWSDLALRPRQLFNYQDFRDLFTEEFLDSRVHLSVGKQAILFTDIVGSSEVYLQNGDPKAFAQIKKHFDEIYPIVAANDGAIVKTMGDSVMSAFSDTLDAVKAAKSLQECFSEDHDELSLRLRTTLNVGPCIAVNLDSNIDYFGRTVNEAAKLQDFAKSGQIVFTDAVWQESGVEQYCKNYCAAVDSLDGKYVVSLNS